MNAINREVIAEMYKSISNGYDGDISMFLEKLGKKYNVNSDDLVYVYNEIAKLKDFKKVFRWSKLEDQVLLALTSEAVNMTNEEVYRALAPIFKRDHKTIAFHYYYITSGAKKSNTSNKKNKNKSKTNAKSKAQKQNDLGKKVLTPNANSDVPSTKQSVNNLKTTTLEKTTEAVHNHVPNEVEEKVVPMNGEARVVGSSTVTLKENGVDIVHNEPMLNTQGSTQVSEETVNPVQTQEVPQQPKAEIPPLFSSLDRMIANLETKGVDVDGYFHVMDYVLEVTMKRRQDKMEAEAHQLRTENRDLRQKNEDLDFQLNEANRVVQRVTKQKDEVLAENIGLKALQKEMEQISSMSDVEKVRHFRNKTYQVGKDGIMTRVQAN